MNDRSRDVEPTYPYPPRFRWLKRAIVASILFVAMYLGAMKWWAYEADRRFSDAIAALRAAGEDVTQPMPQPGAAVLYAMELYEQAASGLNETDRQFLLSLDPADVSVAKPNAQLDGLARSTSASLDLARRARLASPPAGWVGPIPQQRPLTWQRAFAKLLSSMAMREHLMHHDAQAIELLRDALHFANTVDQSDWRLIAHMLSMLIQVHIADVADSISGDLEVLPESSTTTRPDGAASRAQVNSLIEELLDDHVLLEAMPRDMRAFRGMLYAGFDSLLAGEGDTAMYKLDLLRPIQLFTAFARGLDAGDYPAVHQALIDADPDFETMSAITAATRILSMLSIPKLDAQAEQHYERVLCRRVAAVQLAMRLYRLDHDDALPATLDELVPQYLPNVPVDPFAVLNAPLGYRLQPVAQVFSVGPGAGRAAASRFAYSLVNQPATSAGSSPSAPASNTSR